MGYHPRIECTKIPSLQTTRARNSELWFVNNLALEEAILGYAARYTTRYEVVLYALSIEGNHIHQVNRFPKANRAHYMRDFNSTVARAVTRYQKDYSGGRLWARRYSADFLAGDDSVEDYFFYTVLQPVKDGLVDDIKDYPGYNCFEDAITGQARKYKVVKWKQYNDAKRWNPEVSIEEFTEYCTLRYSRLPGYEHLSKAEYEALMRTKLKERTAAMVAGRTFSGSVGPQKLRLVKPGSIPKKTKKSGPKDHRPRVLSKDPNRRSEAKAWYFDTVFEHHRCSLLYRAGDLTVQFPEGTYKPPMFTVAYTGVLG